MHRAYSQNFVLIFRTNTFPIIERTPYRENTRETPNCAGGGDLHGEQVLLATTLAAATAYAGSSLTGEGGQFANATNLQKGILNDAIGTGFNVIAQYGAQQTWGAEHSSYNALGHPDLGRLGALGAIVAQGAYQDAKAAELKEAWDLAKKSNDKNSQQKALELLQGAGYSEDKKREFMQKAAAASFLESKAGDAGDPTLRLQNAIAADGSLGARDAAGMKRASELYYALDSDIKNYEQMSGHPVTKGELIQIAAQYGISPQALFSSGTDAGMLQTQGDWSGRYQAQIAKEAAARQAYPTVTAAPDTRSFGQKIWDNLFPTLSAESTQGNQPRVSEKPLPSMSGMKPYTLPDGHVVYMNEAMQQNVVRTIKEYQARKAGSETAIAGGIVEGALEMPATMFELSQTLGKFGPNALFANILSATGADKDIAQFLRNVTGASAYQDVQDEKFVNGMLEQLKRDPNNLGTFVNQYFSSYGEAKIAGDIIANTVATMGAGVVSKFTTNVVRAGAGELSLFTEKGVVDAINHNADVATELARRALARGNISQEASAFGTRAHSYFEGLNNRLSRRLADAGSEFRVQTEVFLDAAKNVVGRRAAGSIGADAWLKNIADPAFGRVFDLKTYGTVQRLIGATRQSQFVQRFGAAAEELFRAR